MVTFYSGEDSTAILSGFTITGGSGSHVLGTDGISTRLGGGIICSNGSSPIIEHNMIRDNTASAVDSHNGEGGGIEITSVGSNPIIRYNVIWRNKVGNGMPNWIKPGGAICVWDKCKPIIINNTIVDNVAPDGGGVGIVAGGHPILRNNIVVNNHEEGIKIWSGSNGDLFYNNVWNNTPNNYFGNVTNISDISFDPLFVNPDSGDFRLQPGSPCIDAGDPYGPLDPDGTRADIGAKFYHHLDAPYVWKTGEKIDDSDGNNNGRPDAGEIAEISITLINTSLDATGITASLVSDDPGVEVVQGTATFGNMVRNQSANNENNPFKISVKSEVVSHFTKFSINITADGNYTNTDSMKIIVGSPHLLVLDDDNQADYENFFIQPLNSIDIYPEHWDVFAKGTPSKELLHQYKAVIWFTGDDGENALSAEEQTIIADYLDNGGRLLITGQNLGESLVKNGSASDSAFYANYLHAQLVADSTKPTTIVGISGDPITNGLFLNFSGSYGGAGNQSKPDVITATSGATAILKYIPGRQDAGLCYEDPVTKSRLVYLAFGFEGIAGPHEDSAEKLLTNILTWLQGTTDVEQLPASRLPKEFALEQNYPNPFNPATTINYSVAKNSHVKLLVYNMLGQVVALLVDGLKSPGSYHVTWDATNHPSGLYLCRFEADGFRATRKMFLQK